MINVQGLSKQFTVRERAAFFALKAKTRVVNAVDDVSFMANDGEVTGLLGPNGAGKTTTLRMLSTLLTPDRGHATIDGANLTTERATVRQRLGVLGDAKGLYWRLTARENIVYFGRLQGLSESDAQKRADALIDELGLHDLAERPTQGFSQGERMKVAIARALVHNPQTVLLDEPTNGLDIMSTRAMREMIRGLKARGKCVLFSSHIMQEVAALCDRIVIINKGRVIFSGTPQEVLNETGLANLEDAFVQLIGSEEGLFA
ncbi:MAG: ATP-binding cassette domain-containing protein [Casimicrobium sp.]